MRKRLVLVVPGQRFGYWVALKEQSPIYRGLARWLMRCDCGVERVVNQHALRRGRSTSCGSCSQIRPKPYLRGPNHYAWKGDEANDVTKRQRVDNARAWGPCVKCGAQGTDRHHKDGNPGNNIPENIEVLCRRCHMIEDGRLDALIRMAKGSHVP